jgi:triosephosphate isomerase (TIM)
MTGPDRRPLIIGNWKMHLTASLAAAHAREIAALPRPPADREIAVAPSFTSIPAVAAAIRGSELRLAAQDLAFEDEGPYTGEVSGAMLQDLGVVYVLIGHSERRQHLGETDLMVARKVRAALRADLLPVVCVGEQETARASGRAATVVRGQLLRAIEDVPRAEASRLVISYEPVWAIGTGRAASPADADEMQALIRREAARLFGEAANGIRILYGGSVSPANIDAFMARPGIDGALVGTASLDPAEFARIAAFRRPG